MLSSDSTTWLVLAAAVSAVGLVIGIRRSRAASGHVDLFHPLVFPTAYVALATLAPAYWIYHVGDLTYISSTKMGTHTPLILSLACAGFTIGASVPFRGPILRRQAAQEDRPTLRQFGRLFLAFPLAFAVHSAITGGVLTRGQGQNTLTAADTIATAALLFTSAAVLLICAGWAKDPRVMAGVDWWLVGALIIALGLTGKRAAALAAMLIVLAFYAAKRRAQLRLIIVGGGLLLAFANAVVTFRTRAVGDIYALSPIEATLRDLGSVTFTTGVTDRHDLHADTVIPSIIGQLPSPITAPLFGERVTDTAAYKFRFLYDVSENDGYGYSLPAEGVLNFGIVGGFLLPLAMGLAFAWLYARHDVVGNRAMGWIYTVAVATLPFAWRSDLLGTIKGVLYPTLAAAAVLALSRLLYARFVMPKLHQRFRSVPGAAEPGAAEPGAARPSVAHARSSV